MQLLMKGWDGSMKKERCNFLHWEFFVLPKQMFHIQAWKDVKQQWYQIKCKLNFYLIYKEFIRKDS